MIRYWDGEQYRDYYPDFEVTLEGNVLIHVEVKTAAELAIPKIRAKYQAIAADYYRRQQDFRLVTDDEIRRKPLLDNVRTLAYLRSKRSRSAFSVANWSECFGSVAVPFMAAEAKLGRESLLRLLAHGVIECNLNQPLSGETLVGIAKGGRHVAYLL